VLARHQAPRRQLLRHLAPVMITTLSLNTALLI
jgi:hypothetical protein